MAKQNKGLLVLNTLFPGNSEVSPWHFELKESSGDVDDQNSSVTSLTDSINDFLEQQTPIHRSERWTKNAPKNPTIVEETEMDLSRETIERQSSLSKDDITNSDNEDREYEEIPNRDNIETESINKIHVPQTMLRRFISVSAANNENIIGRIVQQKLETNN